MECSFRNGPTRRTRGYFPRAARPKRAMAPAPMSAVATQPKTFTQSGLLNRPVIFSSFPILKMKNIRIGAMVPLRPPGNAGGLRRHVRFAIRARTARAETDSGAPFAGWRCDPATPMALRTAGV